MPQRISTCNGTSLHKCQDEKYSSDCQNFLKPNLFKLDQSNVLLLLYKQLSKHCHIQGKFLGKSYLGRSQNLSWFVTQSFVPKETTPGWGGRLRDEPKELPRQPRCQVLSSTLRVEALGTRLLPRGRLGKIQF